MTTPRAATTSDVAPAARAQRPANLANAITAELVTRIVRGLHPPGTLLPAEPALCAAFAVSRSVVREAVRALQEKGLVQIRQGSGTMVTPSTNWNNLDELVLTAVIAEDHTFAILDDLVVTRRLLESDMAGAAARLADQETVDRLGAIVSQMDDLVDDHVTYQEYDHAFHDTVMRASANRIARSVVQSLQARVVHVARYVERTERALYVASNLGHRRIYDHIAAHNASGAAEAMFAHITDAWLARRGGPGDRLRR